MPPEAEISTDQVIRLEAARMAVSTSAPGISASELVANAYSFYEFLRGPQAPDGPPPIPAETPAEIDPTPEKPARVYRNPVPETPAEAPKTSYDWGKE